MTDETRTPETTSAVPVAAVAPEEPQLNLLLDWQDGERPNYWLLVIAGSLALHLLFFGIAVQMPAFIERSEPPSRVIAPRHITLYLPPDVLTQRAPNRKELTRSIDLADLVATPSEQARRGAPNRSVRHLELPTQITPKPVAKALPPQPVVPPQIVAEVPPASERSQTPQTTPPPPPKANTTASLTPPPAKPGPFQNVEPDVPINNPNPALRPPHVDLRGDAAGLLPGRDSHPAAMSDDNPRDAAPGTPGSIGNTGERHAAIELKSDPQGTDFKPYLTRILGIVRANWKRVIPESVREGSARGRTTVEFIINRDGQIPKMVTANSSGSSSLDRAAVVGLSMSNPLPPLPPDFKGMQVRLAFSFDYNMPAAR